VSVVMDRDLFLFCLVMFIKCLRSKQKKLKHTYQNNRHRESGEIGMVQPRDV
jgi:hypothetical protein